MNSQEMVTNYGNKFYADRFVYFNIPLYIC